MRLPVMPPVDPMLAKAVKEIPTPGAAAGGLAYEPKWDGFRAVVFRDGEEVVITSRNTKELTRYFPELVAGFLTELPGRCVLDGEIVVALDEQLTFPQLQERIHPADSRVQMLAEAAPAAFVAFDLLAVAEDDLSAQPFAERRARLEATVVGGGPSVYLTPLTHDPAVAREWFDRFEGAGLDGVIVKDPTSPYSQGKRTMLKIKHTRTADCVVAGYREHKSSTAQLPLLGSLLLGLYDDRRQLQHVGVAASFPMSRRAELVTELAPLVCPADEHPWGDWQQPAAGAGRRPGAVSRWSTGKDLGFVTLRPDLVCEVRYDAMEGTRFRHTTQFARWRPDRSPESCTYEQLERPLTMTLTDVLSAS